jgi:putative PIN family toxin of toxin-antitoxin system
VVSAFAFGGIPAQALRLALATSEICVSEDLLEEYRTVPDALRAGRKVSAQQRQTLVAGIAAFVSEARVVEPTKAVRLCRDPKDDMVLECCRAARAQLLVTGDRDLLDLDVSRAVGLRRLQIVSPRRYLDLGR